MCCLFSYFRNCPPTDYITLRFRSYWFAMEVLSVYMDLHEGKKKGNVWKLESEAFRDPIEIKIGYDNHELAEFKNDVGSLREELNSKQYQIDRLIQSSGECLDGRLELGRLLYDKQQQIDELRGKIEEDKSEIKSLYKVIADLKTMVETQSGTILHLQEEMKLIQKKITKQPMVFHDKGFISGRESSGLGMINIPDGDYLMIMNTKVGEHNEYVTNCDQLMMDTIHVEGQHYIPFYKLEGGTELDTPTATIYYDLVFIPM